MKPFASSLRLLFPLLPAILGAAVLVGGCQTAKTKMFEAAMQKQRRDTGFSLQSAALDASNWAYLDQGDGDETVLLIHGFAANKDSWLTPVIDPLKERYRIVAPDMPGFGDSSYQPGADYSFSAQAERLVGFLDHLGVDKVHVVGASMGGGIALALAANHPERLLSATVLTAAGVKGDKRSAFFDGLAEGQPNLLLVKTEEDFDRMLPWVFENPPDVPAAAKPFVVAQFAERHAQHAAIFDAMTKNPEWLNDRLSQIAVPVLVVWGKQDKILDPSATDVLAAQVPNAKVVLLDGCGHAIQADRPHRAATALMEFLLSLESAS